MSGEWSVARVLTLLLVFVVVAPAVGGLAVCVEHDELPVMIGAAAGARDDENTSCTVLITEKLHVLGLGFNTVSPVDMFYGSSRNSCHLCHPK